MTASSYNLRGHDDNAERTPYEVLLGAIDDVIAEWLTLVRTEPWAHLPPSRLLDGLPGILPSLIRLAMTGASHLDPELEETIAEEHGRARRADAVPIRGVAEEWNALEEACWRVLARHGVTSADAQAALRHLDVLVDDAIGYALRGYYRKELDSLKGRGLERREGSGDRRVGTPDRRVEAGDSRRGGRRL